MNYCAFCGTRLLAKDARFCHSCGKQLPEVRDAGSDSDSPVDEGNDSDGPPRKRRKRNPRGRKSPSHHRSPRSPSPIVSSPSSSSSSESDDEESRAEGEEEVALNVDLNRERARFQRFFAETVGLWGLKLVLQNSSSGGTPPASKIRELISQAGGLTKFVSTKLFDLFNPEVLPGYHAVIRCTGGVGPEKVYRVWCSLESILRHDYLTKSIFLKDTGMTECPYPLRALRLMIRERFITGKPWLCLRKTNDGILPSTLSPQGRIEDVFVGMSVNGKDFVLNEDLLREILSYLPYHGPDAVILHFGLCCFGSYKAVLRTWRRVRVSFSTLYYIPPYLLQEATTIVLSRSDATQLTFRDWKFLFRRTALFAGVRRLEFNPNRSCKCSPLLTVLRDPNLHLDFSKLVAVDVGSARLTRTTVAALPISLLELAERLEALRINGCLLDWTLHFPPLATSIACGRRLQQLEITPMVGANRSMERAVVSAALVDALGLLPNLRCITGLCVKLMVGTDDQTRELIVRLFNQLKSMERLQILGLVVVDKLRNDKTKREAAHALLFEGVCQLRSLEYLEIVAEKMQQDHVVGILQSLALLRELAIRGTFGPGIVDLDAGVLLQASSRLRRFVIWDDLGPAISFNHAQACFVFHVRSVAQLIASIPVGFFSSDRAQYLKHVVVCSSARDATSYTAFKTNAHQRIAETYPFLRECSRKTFTSRFSFDGGRARSGFGIWCATLRGRRDAEALSASVADPVVMVDDAASSVLSVGRKENRMLLL